MVKILMCGNHPVDKGGMTTVIDQIRSYKWEEKDIDMKFIPTYHPGDLLMRVSYFALSYIKILFALSRYKPDIVYMHMSYKGSFKRKFCIHRICKRYGCKDIVHLHGSEFKKWYDGSSQRIKLQVQRALRESDAVVVLGKNGEKAIRSIEPKARVFMINNAVKIQEKKTSWNDDRFQVLFLGTLIKRKGVEDLLNAIWLLKQEDKIGNMYFVIAGTGAEKERLEKMCEKMELSAYIRFIGWVSGVQKEELFLDSQLVVLPSYDEGLPMSMIEAMSHGIPVVATDVGDVSMAVCEGGNGFLIDPGDLRALADRIKIVSDKAIFTKMSERSREIAGNRFSAVDFFEKLADCFTYVHHCSDN